MSFAQVKNCQPLPIPVVTTRYPPPALHQDESAVKSVEILAGDAVEEAETVTPAPSATATEAAAPTNAPVAPPAGDSVESPPELDWMLNEATGVFSGVIEMGVVTIDNFWGQTTTRGFNGQVCLGHFIRLVLFTRRDAVWGTFCVFGAGVLAVQGTANVFY